MNFLMLLPVVGVLVLLLFIPLTLRRVVEPNEVHIVQARGHTRSYGKGQTAGNAYYSWPSWLPVIGIQTSVLPLSVFDISLDAYDAYDQGRVPFEVDIKAFFRVHDSNQAAERVSDFSQLRVQLTAVLQGAVRSILAKHDIEKIMSERATFGTEFTEEVDHHLKEWGVCSVKSIELMDIRDTADAKTISNIMAKKSSHIEMESRIEVANNKQQAQSAEILAEQAVHIAQQEAEQKVGQRSAEKTKAVGIADQKAKQDIAQESATTAEKDMAVQRVQTVRAAEIAREALIVAADQQRQTSVIKADGDKQQLVIRAEAEKQQTVLKGEAVRDAEKARAEAVLAVGNNEAEVIKNKELAPVTAQITLAKEIGENLGYQRYLIDIRTVEATEKVGVTQASALAAADIRVIANAGKPAEGISSVMDMFTSKGGANLGSALEAFAQTPMGEQLLKTFGMNRPTGTTVEGERA